MHTFVMQDERVIDATLAFLDSARFGPAAKDPPGPTPQPSAGG